MDGKRTLLERRCGFRDQLGVLLSSRLSGAKALDRKGAEEALMRFGRLRRPFQLAGLGSSLWSPFSHLGPEAGHNLIGVFKEDVQ